MGIIPLKCPHCQGTNLAKHGYTKTGKQRYACNNHECHRTFTLEPHSYPGRRQEIKEQIIEMSLNGSGIRDVSRTLHVSTSTVIHELKKREKSREYK
jgi:transposase-like protein